MKAIKLVITAGVLLSSVLIGSSVWGQEKRPVKIPKTEIPRSQFKDTVSIVKDYYLNAVWAINNGDIETAGLYLSKVLSIDSTHAPSHYLIADILANPATALQHSLQANKFDPDNKWYQKQLFNMYMRNRNTTAALQQNEMMIAKNPNDVELYKDRATAFLMTGNPSSAMSMLDTISQKFGTDETILMAKLQIYDRLPVSQKTIDDLNTLSQSFPQNPYIYTALGDMYMKQENNPKALDYYLKAEAIDSTNIKTILALSDFYMNTKNFDKLFDCMERLFRSDEIEASAKLNFFTNILSSPFFYKNYVLKVNYLAALLKSTYPDNSEVRKAYAQHQINMGNLDGATAEYIDMAQKGLGGSDTYNSLIGIKSYLGQPDSVIYYCNQALPKFPEMRVDYQLSKANAMMGSGRYEEAVKLMEQEVGHATTDSVKCIIYGFIGDVYHSKGDDDNCFKNYKKALRYDPENIIVLNNYSYYLSEKEQNLNEALKMIQKVIKQEPENGTYLDTYGWILYKLGRYEEAKKVMKDALSFDITNSPTLLLHYGDILYKLKEYSNARIYWRMAEKAGEAPAEIQKRMALPHAND